MLSLLKGRGGLIVRSILSMGLLGALAYHIGAGEIVSHLKTVTWQAAAAATLVLATSVFLVTPRWAIILGVLGHRVSWRLLIGSVFLGFLFNQLLPTAVGGDVIRAWRVRQLDVPWETAINSVLLDRATGVLVSLLGAAILLPFTGLQKARGDMIWTVGAAAAIMMFGLVLLWMLARWRHAPIRLLGSFQRWGARLYDSVLAFLKNPTASAMILALAILSQFLPVIAIVILAHALRVPLPMLDVAFVTFVATLASAVPISIAGWGIREAALVYLFGLYGIEPEAAFAVSILFGLTVTLSAAPGTLVLLHRPTYLRSADIK